MGRFLLTGRSNSYQSREGSIAANMETHADHREDTSLTTSRPGCEQGWLANPCTLIQSSRLSLTEIRRLQRPGCGAWNAETSWRSTAVSRDGIAPRRQRSISSHISK